jgi:hypothetical protein
MAAKRDIFSEIMSGIAEMKAHREGKITLRSYNIESAPLPKVDSKLIRGTRKAALLARGIARRLRINEREAESPSGGAGAAGKAISRHAVAVE